MTELLNTEIDIVTEVAPVDATVVNPEAVTEAVTEAAPAVDLVLEDILSEIKANVSTKTFIILENEIGKEAVKIISLNSNPTRSGKLLLVALNTAIDELSKANEPVVEEVPVEAPVAEILPPETAQ